MDFEVAGSLDNLLHGILAVSSSDLLGMLLMSANRELSQRSDLEEHEVEHRSKGVTKCAEGEEAVQMECMTQNSVGST